jgi:hypothetical protein
MEAVTDEAPTFLGIGGGSVGKPLPVLVHPLQDSILHDFAASHFMAQFPPVHFIVQFLKKIRKIFG